jgi:hypothetical protein
LASSPKAATVVGILLLILFLASGPALAQSGRGVMRGYVVFEGVAFDDVAKANVRASVELRGNTALNRKVYTAETNERGLYEIKVVPMGEYVLRISAPGYKTYETELYIPSDFVCNLAVKLKKTKK